MTGIRIPITPRMKKKTPSAMFQIFRRFCFFCRPSLADAGELFLVVMLARRRP
jgi:hypothetical protein